MLIFYSHGCFLDIMPKGIHKGSTLLKVLDHLKVSIDHTYVFGNSENDFSMLKVTPHGYLLKDDELLVEGSDCFKKFIYLDVRALIMF